MISVRNILFISIALEQVIFLYFSFGSFTITGARLLQFFVFFLIITIKPHLFSINLLRGNNTYGIFFILIILTFTIALINLALGNYQLSFSQNVLNESSFSYSFQSIIRETIVYIYFFIIYVFLLNNFIKSSTDLIVFFKYFRVIFLSCLFAGFFLYIIDEINGFNLIPRQLNYGFDDDYIRLRYHGFFGEPRDAVVLLSIGLSILTLEQIYKMKINMIMRYQYSYILNTLLIISAIFLTQSGTSLLASVLFIILILINILVFFKLNFKTIILIALAVLYVSVLLGNQRVENYFNELSILSSYMNGKISMGPYLGNQLNNILPIWLSLEYFYNLDIIPLLFGNGIASSAFVSYYHLGDNYVEVFANPHSQITRIMFEFGLIGSFLWYLLFYNLIFKIKEYIPRSSFTYFLVIFTFSFAALLAHRNPEMFLLVGVTFSVYRMISKSN